MGTRGTLRVLMSNQYIVENLTTTLLNLRFADKQTVQDIREGKSQNINQKDSYTHILMNRDLGAKTLLILAGMPRLYDDTFKKIVNVIPDWIDVFDESDESLREEGNYEIHIECKVDPDNEGYIARDSEIRFRLSGEFWDVTRQFDWDYLPTDDEIQEWENEARRE